MEEYNAVLELGKGKDTAEDLIENLIGFGAAVSPTNWGLWELIITLPANDLRTAASTALALVAAATPRKVVTIQLMTTQEFDRRVADDDPADAMSVADAAARLRVSPQRVRQMITEGKLPANKVGKVYTLPTAAVESLRATASARALTEIIANDPGMDFSSHRPMP